MIDPHTTDFSRPIIEHKLICSQSKSRKGYTRQFTLACGHTEYAAASRGRRLQRPHQLHLADRRAALPGGDVMKTEITFHEITKTLVYAMRGDVRVAALRRLKGREWEVTDGGDFVYRSTLARVRRAAIARFCQCAECRQRKLEMAALTATFGAEAQ